MPTADERPLSSPTPPDPPAGPDRERAAPSPPAARSVGRQDHHESRPLPANEGSTTPGVDLSTTPPDVSPNAPHRPIRFGEYRILELIGQGAMGSVYKARHSLLDVVDAVKLISSRYGANTALRARFLAEMRTLVKLDHPHIVSIRTAGEVDGELYFSMAYESGGDLAARLRPGKPTDPLLAADLVRQLADGIDYANKKNIFHCDLKPANVLLSGEPGTPLARCAPRISDFGLALIRASGEAGGDGHGAGGPIGTPGYMPPEQARGHTDEIGPASDVYGLGAILYDLLTGRPPFQGTVPEVLRQVKEVPPQPPRDLNPKVPRRLEAICLKCLEKDPARRYPTAGHLGRDLHGFLRPWWKRAWRELVVVAAFLFLCAGLALAGWEKYQAPRAEARAEFARAREARDRGDRVEALGHYDVALKRYNDLLAGGLRPDRRALSLARARVQNGRGFVLDAERRFKDAEVALDDARRTLEELPDADRDRTDCRLLLAETYHNLGSHEDSLNRPWGALEQYTKALSLREKLRPELGNQRDFIEVLARSHGYIGDVYLELQQLDKAHESYWQAKKLRKSLLEVNNNDREARCLCARDAGNLSYYYDWGGDLGNALRHARNRLTIYDPLGKEPLPGDYLTERADALRTVAELELDRDRPADDVAELLDQAESEYRSILASTKSEGAEAPPPALQSGLAENAVTRAKYHVLRGEWEKAGRALAEAETELRKLRDARADRSGDLYQFALLFALRARLPGADRGGDEALAMDRLKDAVAAGYRHLIQLRRERGFDELRKARPGEFLALVGEVERQRNALAGGGRPEVGGP